MFLLCLYRVEGEDIYCTFYCAHLANLYTANVNDPNPTTVLTPCKRFHLSNSLRMYPSPVKVKYYMMFVNVSITCKSEILSDVHECIHHM